MKGIAVNKQEEHTAEWYRNEIFYMLGNMKLAELKEVLSVIKAESGEPLVESDSNDSYDYNLRFTIGNVMEKVFHNSDKANLCKMANLFGIEEHALSNLFTNGKINETDFEQVCKYLKPSAKRKWYWREHYCIMG